MNIIEAIQAAEQGKLIQNGLLKRINHCLKYIGNGVFSEYLLMNGVAIHKYDKSVFSMGHIISNNWEIITEPISFKNKKDA